MNTSAGASRRSGRLPLIQDDAPELRRSLLGGMQTGISDGGVDARVGVRVRAISAPADREPEVEESDRKGRQPAIARQHEAVKPACAGRRKTYERIGVRVAANDAVERDDVSGIDLVGPRREVALDDLDAVEQVCLSRHVARYVQVGTRAVDEDSVRGAVTEQLAIDDPDPGADVDDRSTLNAATADHLEQHRRRPVRPEFPVSLAVPLG